jgi:hypothetical protein
VNEVLSPVWSEQLVRLQLGVELVDALGSAARPAGATVHREDVPRPYPVPAGPVAGPPRGDTALGLPMLGRGPSGRFALPFGPRARRVPAPPASPALLRIVDPSRRFVPRRVAVPVPTLADVVAAELAHDLDPAHPLEPRACRLVLFPGSAFSAPAGSTVVRGRVTRQGVPVPWVRVAATVTNPPPSPPALPAPTWWAHGDDRGEFLLVVGTLSAVLARAATRTVDLDLTVRVRPFPPAGTPVDSPTGSTVAPLWHLPVEPRADLDPGDPVARGVAVPDGYVVGTTETVTCRRGATTGAVHLVLN